MQQSDETQIPTDPVEEAKQRAEDAGERAEDALDRADEAGEEPVTE
jgi:hypothetical protein